MRIAIYVYSDAATFGTQEFFVHPSAGAVISQNEKETTLARGVYKCAKLPTGGESGNFDIIVVANDKDPWPDPPGRLQSALPAMSLPQLRDFFPNALGLAS
jgi:hypothetical protein